MLQKINQVYFTKIKNCPKLDVPKVRVNEKYLKTCASHSRYFSDELDALFF